MYMMRRCASAAFLFAFPFVKAESVGSSDIIPSIEVSLAPPALPQPSISSAIGDMDKSREIYEASLMDNLRKHQTSLLKVAKHKIRSVIDNFVHASNSASLLKQGGPRIAAFTEITSVKINVPSLTSTYSADLISGIRGLARSHADFDKTMFQRAESDMATLVDFIVSELTGALKTKSLASLQRGGATPGFLQRVSRASNAKTNLPDQANVKITTSDNSFPTSSSIVESFESRQSVAADFTRLKINLMMLDLTKSLNSIIKRDLAVIKG